MATQPISASRIEPRAYALDLTDLERLRTDNPHILCSRQIKKLRNRILALRLRLLGSSFLVWGTDATHSLVERAVQTHEGKFQEVYDTLSATDLEPTRLTSHNTAVIVRHLLVPKRIAKDLVGSNQDQFLWHELGVRVIPCDRPGDAVMASLFLAGFEDGVDEVEAFFGTACACFGYRLNFFGLRRISYFNAAGMVIEMKKASLPVLRLAAGAYLPVPRTTFCNEKFVQLVTPNQLWYMSLTTISGTRVCSMAANSLPIEAPSSHGTGRKRKGAEAGSQADESVAQRPCTEGLAHGFRDLSLGLLPVVRPDGVADCLQGMSLDSQIEDGDLKPASLPTPASVDVCNRTTQTDATATDTLKG